MNFGTEARVFGEYSVVPENYQDAVRAGLSFFECRLKEKNFYGLTVFGTFDVKVTEESEIIHGHERPRFDVKWLIGRQAGAKFEVSDIKRGFCVAFVVDDPFWHNRMMLIDNPPYDVVAYHTPEGIYPGSVVKAELGCLREVVNNKITVYQIVDESGRLIERCEGDKKKAEEVLLKNKGGSLVVTETWERKEEVRRMVAQGNGLVYGWTTSEDFKRSVRPKVQALIKARGISRTPVQMMPVAQTPEALREQVMGILKGLSKKEKKELLNEAEKLPAETGPVPGTGKKLTGIAALRERAAELKIPGAEVMDAGLLKKAIAAAEKSATKAKKNHEKNENTPPPEGSEETVT